MRALALAGALAMTPLAAPAQGPALVTGEALYRERIAAPDGAVFTATLSDVSRADAPAQELSRVVITDAGNPPYRFALPYDPARIDDRARYAVRATLSADGRLLFTSDTHAPVLTDGAGETVSILMVRVAQPPEPDGGDRPLRGTRWIPVLIGETPFADDTRAHVAFGNDGQLSGNSGCNQMGGEFVASREGAFLSDRIRATLMACPEPGMSEERATFGALAAARFWRIKGDVLTLLAEGAPLATFRAFDDPQP